MTKKNNASIEPKITEIGNGWLRDFGLDYKLQRERLNLEIDSALENYRSKTGGKGGNIPDAKLLLRSDKQLKDYPILIEYKGQKDKLIAVDENNLIANTTKKNQPHYSNIKNYAVNGAVHYANALLHYTGYTDIIAIGMTGYKNEEGEIACSIGVYLVSNKNLGAGQKIGEFSDFSFLKEDHFDKFVEQVNNLQLSQKELENIKHRREHEIEQSLKKLNNDLFHEEKGLGENERVLLVAASIIATLGIPGTVAPLEKADLHSSSEKGNTDGEIVVRKIEAFLEVKKLPQEKKRINCPSVSKCLSRR